ncbi:MAG: tetratricopeptide repeat protein [Candidatus Eiseniibacteriota bacterium]
MTAGAEGRSTLLEPSWIGVLSTLALVGAVVVSGGCAYFNTFYSAKKNFNEAESQLRQNPDPEARAGAAQAGLYDKAIQGATKVIRDYPKSKWVDDAVLMIGRCQLAKGEYVQARVKFDELAQNFPKSDLLDQATYWAGVAADRDRERDLALALYDSLITDYPNSKHKDDAILRRANLFLAMKDPDRATTDLKELSTRPGQMGYDAGLKLAESLFANKDYAGARAEFDRVAERAPTEPLRLEARLRAGDCDEAMSDYARASETYLKLLRESKTEDAQARARLRYGTALALSGQTDRGLTELRNVVQDRPRTPYAAEAMFRIGFLEEVVREDFDAAAIAYDGVAQQQQSSPFVIQATQRRGNLARLAEFRAAEGDSAGGDRGAEVAFQAAELFLFQLGKPDRAVIEYEKVERDHSESPLAPKAAFARGWVLARRLGKGEEARAAMESVIQRYPDSEYSTAAREFLGSMSDSTYALDPLPLTTFQTPLVPGNQLYVPPPPLPAPKPGKAPVKGATPGAVAAAGDTTGVPKNAQQAADQAAAAAGGPGLPTAHQDSLRAYMDSVRSARRRAVTGQDTTRTSAPPDTGSRAPADTGQRAPADTSREGASTAG